MNICINHTSRPATARCSSCHKPICSDCILKGHNEVYCSEECAANAARFRIKHGPVSGPGFFGTLTSYAASLFRLAIVIIMIIGLLAYVLKIPYFVELMNKWGM